MHDQKTHAFEVGRLFRRPDSTDDFSQEHKNVYLVLCTLCFVKSSKRNEEPSSKYQVQRNEEPSSKYQVQSSRFGEYLRRVTNIARRRRNDRLIAYVNLLTLLNRPTNVVFADEI